MSALVPHPVSELLIRADVGEVRRASAWLESGCFERGVPQEEISRLDLCLHEALANVIAHGNEDAPSPVCLQLEVSRHEATVTVCDSCPAFNPLSVPKKSTPRSLAEADPGGLGLLIIRKFSDAQHYRYSKGQNRLSFSARWNAA